MVKKIALYFSIIVVVFLSYVSTRPSKFNFERSGVINAPAEKIFPYLSDFKKGSIWNPYDQKDPAIKRVFSGPEAQVGSVMEFDGNADAGTGKLEITKLTPNQMVEIRLTMTKPFKVENLIIYTLTPEPTGTRFSWAMQGDGGFIGKLFSVFVDCEKMLDKDFIKGINQLRSAIETQK